MCGWFFVVVVVVVVVFLFFPPFFPRCKVVCQVDSAIAALPLSLSLLFFFFLFLGVALRFFKRAAVFLLCVYVCSAILIPSFFAIEEEAFLVSLLS